MSATNFSLVIRRAYQQILVVKVKKSAKLTLLSFNITAIVLHDLMVSKMTFLKRDSAVGVFAWVMESSNSRLELQVE